MLKIFILPPSKEELEKRLISRNQDGKDSIKKDFWPTQDIKNTLMNMIMFITNDNVENCFNKILKIIKEHPSN